ncbi:glycosyltransferase family 2 protein [Flaviramulus aquimarinus]|uniref:Glycosyltransferase family 2 protein n=1 Tax=Flaviramulus aquimarinus TaxID=1170456 RepID=A0ABP9EP31_9FLAO
MKISIITINYNNLEGLKKTVNSVKSQTYTDFEYLVVDGGSTDGSADYLESHNAMFDYKVSELDNGIYHAMNKGVKKANGEYVLFLNSGDYFYSSKVLEENHLQIKEQDIIYFNLQVIEGNKTFIKEYPDLLSFSYFVKDTLPHPATFIKKDIFVRTEFYKEDFKIVSDWKFFMDAICRYSVTYRHVSKPLSTFLIGGMSSDPKNSVIKQNEIKEVLNTYYSAYMQDLDDVITFRNTLNNLRASRIIKLLIKLGFLNKF